jgi:hypothetical protein
MAVGLSALSVGSALPPEDILVLISARGCVNPKSIVLLEGFDKLEKINDMIGTKTA